jgi:hypothetical protein
MNTKRKDLLLYHGGLMRCCTASFAQWVETDPEAEAEPGQNITCVYENRETMVVNDRATGVEWIEMQGLRGAT